MKRLAVYFQIFLFSSALISCANTTTPVSINSVPVNPESERVKKAEQRGVPAWVWVLRALAVIGLAAGGSDESTLAFFDAEGKLLPKSECD